MLSKITFLVLLTPAILLEVRRSGTMQQIEHSMANTQLLVNDCAKQMDASVDDITNFLSHKAITASVGKCLVACVLIGHGIIVNGVIQNDTLVNTLKLYPKLDEGAKSQEAINDCIEVATPAGDSCTYAAVFHACLDVRMKRIVKGQVMRIREDDEPALGKILMGVGSPRGRTREELRNRVLSWSI